MTTLENLKIRRNSEGVGEVDDDVFELGQTDLLVGGALALDAEDPVGCGNGAIDEVEVIELGE